jgi:hypothetical protein
MDRLLLVVLATLGMLSNLGSHPPQGIFWIMDGLVAVFMFLMGVRLDDALRRFPFMGDAATALQGAPTALRVAWQLPRRPKGSEGRSPCRARKTDSD